MSKTGLHAVEMLQVSKRFGQQLAVSDLELCVPEGTIYGFIGPNGAGKTTTLRMILRIFRPDYGIVRVLGADSGGAADDRVGYLPEERGLYKKMQVHEILCFHARLKGIRKCRHLVDDWLARMDMTHVAKRQVQSLSKGMSQKIQFIAAVIGQPRLLILDEPFSGLDPVNVEVVRKAVLDLQRSGVTILLSTHDMTVAEHMCDRICMIYQGRKVLDGSLQSIQQQFGTHTLRVRMAGSETLELVPGVFEVSDLPDYVEIRLAPDADPQAVLSDLLSRGRVEYFEIARPSLHDIFLRIVHNNALSNSREAANV